MYNMFGEFRCCAIVSELANAAWVFAGLLGGWYCLNEIWCNEEGDHATLAAASETNMRHDENFN